MFGFGKNRFLGIDIGTSSIKIAELKIGNKKPVLSNYAWVKLGKFAEIQTEIADEVLVQYLKKMFAAAKFKGDQAYVSMPAFGGLITLIEFPEMTKEDLDQAIKFEAHKYIPTALDDIALSWEVVNKNKSSLIAKKKEESDLEKAPEEGQSKLQVLLVAAPKSKVQRYERIIKGSGLDLRSIEIESFSLARSLVGNDTGNFVLIDIGSRVCNIILVEKGLIKVNRNIDAGGRDITKTVARGMNVDETRAERLKISGKDFLGKETSIKLTTLDMIIEETKRVLNAYYKNEGERKLDGVLLSGGTAGLPGIEQYFTQGLGIKAISGNPLGRIEYDPKLATKLSRIAPQFSVSIGLALKGIEEKLKK